MRKLCFITTASTTLRAFVLDTANYLYYQCGYDIAFICDKDDNFAASLPSHIHYIPVPMKRGVNFDGLVAILRLMRICRREHYDIVQYSTPNAAVYASIAARLAGVPVRLYCQWGIRYVGMVGWKRRVFKILERIPCVLSTDIRSVSRKNLSFAVREGLFPSGKSRVLGKGGTIGVDLSHYDIECKTKYRREIRIRHDIGDEFVFGFVGRLSRDKGANEMIKAFRSLSSTISSKLVCVGGIEAGMDDSLRKWAERSQDVIFSGQINHDEVKKYYAAFDCYLHPSYREGFGMVIQEAGAMGCPIITTDIPGASEVMEEGISCLLARPKDADSLEKRMKEIMYDDNLRNTLGCNARKRVEQCFDRREMLETQRQDYANLLKKGVCDDQINVDYSG